MNVERERKLIYLFPNHIKEYPTQNKKYGVKHLTLTPKGKVTVLTRL